MPNIEMTFEVQEFYGSIIFHLTYSHDVAIISKICSSCSDVSLRRTKQDRDWGCAMNKLQWLSPRASCVRSKCFCSFGAAVCWARSLLAVAAYARQVRSKHRFPRRIRMESRIFTGTATATSRSSPVLRSHAGRVN